LGPTDRAIQGPGGDCRLMELVEFGRLTHEQYAELVGEEENPWGPGGLELEWRLKDRHVGLRDQDGTLLAVAGLVVANVVVGESDAMPVVGLGGVLVAARYRGHGFGGRVIDEALAHARLLGPSIAMLFCQPDRAKLYARRGFVEIPRPVLVDQPAGAIEMPMVTMWRPLQEGAKLPGGPVKIDGLPF
jgi:predicted N-acetyltransferase YhbS